MTSRSASASRLARLGGLVVSHSGRRHLVVGFIRWPTTRRALVTCGRLTTWSIRPGQRTCRAPPVVRSARIELSPACGCWCGRGAAGQHGRQVVGAKADQRVVGVQRGDHQLTDLALGTGHSVPGARLPITPHSSAAPGLRARWSRAGDQAPWPCQWQALHALAALHQSRSEGNKASTDSSGLGHAGQPPISACALQDDTSESWRADVLSGPQASAIRPAPA